jgi:predicted oxidoreductase
MQKPLSKIMAGTMLWGKWGRKWDCKQMSSAIHLFLDLGIYTFDHADIYGGYTNEADFGEAWVASGVKRDDIQLVTKCGIKLVTDNRPYTIHHYDYSSEHIVESCHKSLRNLRTDYLDVFLFHRPSPLMHPGEMADAVTKLKESGKILSFGVSNFTPSQTDLIRQFIPVDFNQIEFSLTHYAPMLDGSIDYMMLHNIVPMAWGPLGDIYKNKDNTPARVWKKLEQLSAKYQVTPDILLVKWITKHPAGILPVVGTTNEDRIKQLKKIHDFDLTREDWFDMWTTVMGQEVP